MRVNIELREPSLRGKFADIKLSFVDTQRHNRNVNLNVNFSSLNDFTKDTSSVAFDFFLMSSIVYGIDNLLQRYEYSIDAWAREIEVCFPVHNLATWNNASEKLEQILTFLTGDYWTVTFRKNTIREFYREKNRRWKSRIPTYDQNAYTFACLFSGGLDSLVGAIDGLETLPLGSKGILISHFDSTSPGPNADQSKLFGHLINQAAYKNRIVWIQEVVSLPNYDNDGAGLAKESSFRSRSLLFISLGVYCVNALPNCTTLTIPENGTISLNFPLTPSRSSTLSTRTTHPFYLDNLQQLINQTGLNTILVNPYKNQTKGELVDQCAIRSVLQGVYEKSVSCGKRGRKQSWDTKVGTSHCGVCMPCIYRRAALHKIGFDTQTYGIDIFSTQKELLSVTDMPALFDFLSRPLTREQIKRTLLVSGSLRVEALESSAALVERVRLEIKQWITDKGNDNLRRLAGIT